MLGVASFIDFQNVDTSVDPVQQVLKEVVLQSLTLKKSGNVYYHLPLTEQRVSLQDNLFQLMIDSDEFSILNFDSTKGRTVAPNYDENAVFTYLLDLDNEV